MVQLNKKHFNLNKLLNITQHIQQCKLYHNDGKSNAISLLWNE
jgi:hypothetical protein